MTANVILPPMRPLGPLRVSLDAFDQHPAYARLLAEAPVTGCCPVLMSDDCLQYLRFPDDPEQTLAEVAQTDAADVLAGQWPGSCYDHCSCREPFGDEFPGLVAGPGPVDDADAEAAELAGRWAWRHLALVPVSRPADVPAAVGWPGTCNYRDDVVSLSAVLRSWEDRFGARLVMMDRATLWVSVAAPPWTEAECLGVAAEHFSFCCDVDGEDPRPLRVYASTLRGNRTWRFWWD